MKIQPYQTRMIKTLQGKLGLDDGAYRLLLSGYGVTSSTKLDTRQAAELTKELTAKAVAAGVWEQKEKGQTRTLTDDDMSKKIRALWIELHQAGKVRDGSEKALAAFVKRMSRKDSLNWCSVVDKTAIIEALKKWLEREEKP
jgi:phage gp16-like protein